MALSPDAYGAPAVTGARLVTPRPPSRPTIPRALQPLATDPNVVLAGLTRGQTLMDANAALRQGRSQALVGFGDAALARALGNTVDPNTAAAAQANQYSTLANLAHQNMLNRMGLFNTLAAHGLTRSGATGFQQGELARGYGQAGYDALQSLLANLNQQLGQYLGTANTANSAYQNALLQALQRFGQNPLGLLGG